MKDSKWQHPRVKSVSHLRTSQFKNHKRQAVLLFHVNLLLAEISLQGFVAYSSSETC